MKLQKRIFNWGDGRKLKDVKAIVLHWDASKGIAELDTLWKWMNRRGEAMRADGETAPYYHYLVSHQNILQTTEHTHRAIHCGHRTYRKKAKEFFGDRVCSSKDSPNNHTLGVCMLHDVADTGGYHSDTLETAIELLASLCVEYSLDPLTQLIRHSDITNEKDIPCPRAFFEDDDDPDDYWNEFKHWVDIAVKDNARRGAEIKSKEGVIK